MKYNEIVRQSPVCTRIMATKQNNTMDDVCRIPPTHCTKVFLQRDFNEGTGVQFQTKFPSELNGKIDQETFTTTVNTVNSYYKEAEGLGGRTYCESCFACLTAYIVYLCMEPHYTKCIKKAGRYIQEQNKNYFLPRGLLLVDPSERGMRVFEICILNEPSIR